jgi:hypothetical protein
LGIAARLAGPVFLQAVLLWRKITADAVAVVVDAFLAVNQAPRLPFPGAAFLPRNADNPPRGRREGEGGCLRYGAS